MHCGNFLCMPYLQQQSLARPFVQLSAEYGLDEKSVRTIFHDYVVELERPVHISTPVSSLVSVSVPSLISRISCCTKASLASSRVRVYLISKGNMPPGWKLPTARCDS